MLLTSWPWALGARHWDSPPPARCSRPIASAANDKCTAWPSKPAPDGYTVGDMKSPLNRGGLRFYVVAVALAVGTLYFRSTTARSIVAGLPLLLAGVCLHTWAKGCLRQNRVVATIGPYRFVRHPFYLANALIDFALAVMAGWLPLVIVLPVWC